MNFNFLSKLIAGWQLLLFRALGHRRQKRIWSRRTLEQVQASMHNFSYPHRPFLVEIISTLMMHTQCESDRILELGCGVGANLSCLAEKFAGSIIGIDISKQSITVGNNLISEITPPHITRLIHDFRSLEIFSSGMFAITFSDAAMYTLGSRTFNNLLREADRVTNGFLIFLELQAAAEKTKFTRDGFLRNYGQHCEKIGMSTVTFPLPPHLRTGGRWPQIGAITVAARNKSSSELASILARFS